MKKPIENWKEERKEEEQWVALNTRILKRQHRFIRKKARETGESIATIIRELIDDAVNREKKEE